MTVRTASPLERRREPVSDSTLLMGIAIAVFVFLYGFSMLFLGVGFRRPSRIFDMLNDNAHLIIISCGLSIVMITGGIDISVGGVVGFVTMLCVKFLNNDILPSQTMSPEVRIACAVLIAVGVGLAFGLLQGALVAYMDIQPFIVTLAGMFFARGMTTVVSPANVSMKSGPIQDILSARIDIPWLGYEEVRRNKTFLVSAHMEYIIILALLAVIISAVMLRKTRPGRNFYAVGGNRQSALMLGVNVRRTRFLAHVISGLLAGVAGFVYLWHTRSGNIFGASAAEMQAIASSIIGGTLLTGGVGNVVGTFFGVLILALIKPIVTDAGKIQGLEWLKAAWWQQVFNGGVLCFFILLQSVLLKMRAKLRSHKKP